MRIFSRLLLFSSKRYMYLIFLIFISAISNSSSEPAVNKYQDYGCNNLCKYSYNDINQYPIANTKYAVSMTSSGHQSTHAEVIANGIVISEPRNGDQFEPGKSIRLTAVAQNGFEPVEVLLFSSEFGLQFDSAPFTDEVILPTSLHGDYDITAIAKDSSGNMTTSETVTIHVTTTSSLTKINISNGDIVLFKPLEKRQIHVSGTYSDGVARNITSDPNTSYAIASPDIASVNSDGVLAAVSNGRSTLRVTNNGVEETVVVIVVGNDYDGY